MTSEEEECASSAPVGASVQEVINQARLSKKMIRMLNSDGKVVPSKYQRSTYGDSAMTGYLTNVEVTRSIIVKGTELHMRLAHCIGREDLITSTMRDRHLGAMVRICRRPKNSFR